MKKIRQFQPKVRLREMLRGPGVTTVREALRRADVGVESIRERCLAGVDEKIEEIMELAVGREPSTYGRMYQLANEIYAEAGVFGLEELSQAAHSLCSLLGDADENAPQVRAVEVHIDAMRALRTPGVAANAALRAAVLKELRGLSAKLARAARPPAPAQAR